MVKNKYGVEIDFDAAEQLMSSEICEALHAKMAPCTEQQFFDAYCEAHEEQFGEQFELAKENPVW